MTIDKDRNLFIPELPTSCIGPIGPIIGFPRPRLQIRSETGNLN